MQFVQGRVVAPDFPAAMKAVERKLADQGHVIVAHHTLRPHPDQPEPGRIWWGYVVQIQEGENENV